MTPLLLDVVPVGFAEAVIFGGVEQFQYMFSLTASVLAWIPVVNALSTILFIKCYRRALLDIGVNALGRVVRYLGWKTAIPPCARHTAVSPLPSTNQG